MKVTVTARPTFDTRILFVDQEGAAGVRDFEGKKGTVAVRYDGETTHIWVGVGTAEECTAQRVRGAAASAIRAAIALKRSKVSLTVPKMACWDGSLTRAALQGVLLGAYSFTKYKKEKPDQVRAVEVAGRGIAAAEARRIGQVCDCVNYARDLVNENASVMYPEALAREARRIGRDKALRVTVLDHKALTARGLGLLSAVGQGSPYPPRLIIMEYRGNPQSRRRTAIVGKGITFDSGGLNIKPTGHIETMRCDMAGAAAVMGTMKALLHLRPRVNVLGVVAAAYNAVDGTAYIPGDIYRAYDGTTVEIKSTDAEGRLALADALSYLRKHYAPAEIIDLATLTGGVLYALGTTVAAIVGTSDALATRLFELGEETGERLWRLPLYEEHSDSIKGDLADLRNTSKLPKGHAGTITGAAFIKEFVGDTPWAHLDIAGTAFNEGDSRGEVPKNGTGFGVRLLAAYLAAKR